jgi:hypothetical protein
MGREFIGDCSNDPEFGDYETELIIKYLKQACGSPPRGVNIEVTWEGCEIGNEGDETQYPVISVVWDDSVTGYPDEYIGKCIEAFERFDLPEETYKRGQQFFEIQNQIEELFDKISRLRTSRGRPS